MRNILSRSGIETLTSLARTNALLAFDFDGTLAPIVSDRDRARMRKRTSELFRRVCRLYPCVVISGRGRSDVRRRLGTAPVRFIVGNHGLEPSPDMALSRSRISALRPQLEDALRACRGVEIEDKRYSLAIHYRRCANEPQARRLIHGALARTARSMRLVTGKLVINVVPRDAPHKGDALTQQWREVAAKAALYVGDDITDEDVFTLDRPDDLLSIRVGRSRASAAAYYLRDQGEIDGLLARLCALREVGPAPTRTSVLRNA